MKIDEFKKQLKDEVTSIVPDVLQSVKASNPPQEKLSSALIISLSWQWHKKILLPIIYGIIAIFIFILGFSTLSSDNVSASSLTYLNLEIVGDEVLDADIVFNENQTVTNIKLTSTAYENEITEIEKNAIGKTVTETVELIINNLGINDATVNVGAVNDSQEYANSYKRIVKSALNSIYETADKTLNLFFNDNTKEKLVIKAKNFVKNATLLMSTDELLNIVFA